MSHLPNLFGALVSALVYVRDGGRVVKLDAMAVRSLRAFEQHGSGTEAGGVLLGRWIMGSGAIVVDAITTPSKDDRRGRFSFFREMREHQRQIDEAYARSNGTCSYLGEWHTHPEPNPTPSWIDRTDWMRRLKNDRVDIDALVFIIVGTASIGVWLGQRATRELHALELRYVLQQHAASAVAERQG
jgi:integrative and conjugative element protein (TIGR02256 family)